MGIESYFKERKRIWKEMTNTEKLFLFDSYIFLIGAIVVLMKGFLVGVATTLYICSLLFYLLGVILKSRRGLKERIANIHRQQRNILRKLD